MIYEGFSPDAQQAFAYAVSLWEAYVSSPVPIRIHARWSQLDENVLGSAGPSSIVSFSDAPYPNTWYPPALEAAIRGTSPLKSGEYDIEASFSSDITWYFGTDAAPPVGTYDLVTVVPSARPDPLGYRHRRCHLRTHGRSFRNATCTRDGNSGPNDLRE